MAILNNIVYGRTLGYAGEKVIFNDFTFPLTNYENNYPNFSSCFQKDHTRIHLRTLVFLLNEQALINEQALNSKVLPARFLLTVYVVPNKRAGTK